MKRCRHQERDGDQHDRPEGELGAERRPGRRTDEPPQEQEDGEVDQVDRERHPSGSEEPPLSEDPSGHWSAERRDHQQGDDYGCERHLERPSTNDHEQCGPPHGPDHIPETWTKPPSDRRGLQQVGREPTGEEELEPRHQGCVGSRACEVGRGLEAECRDDQDGSDEVTSRARAARQRVCDERHSQVPLHLDLERPRRRRSEGLRSHRRLDERGPETLPGSIQISGTGVASARTRTPSR